MPAKDTQPFRSSSVAPHKGSPAVCAGPKGMAILRSSEAHVSEKDATKVARPNKVSRAGQPSDGIRPEMVIIGVMVLLGVAVVALKLLTTFGG